MGQRWTPKRNGRRNRPCEWLREKRFLAKLPDAGSIAAENASNDP
jgi:hypothetical protein